VISVSGFFGFSQWKCSLIVMELMVYFACDAEFS
jgi:hypothetical protein